MMKTETTEEPAETTRTEAARRRSRLIGASSGWIVAAGACIAVALLCDAMATYRAVLNTTMARMQMMPSNVADGAPDTPAGFTQLAETWVDVDRS